MNKIWKNIKGFEGLYQVSNYGEIKSLAKKKGWATKGETILKQKTTQLGYKTIVLSRNTKPFYLSVHRIVASAFIKNPLSKKQVNHKDGSKINNLYTNLEWATSSENLKHAFRIGIKNMKGDRHNNRKLDSKKVELIRNSELMGADLARLFNVCPATICLIKKRKIWNY